MKDIKTKQLKKHIDSRGWLAEIFRPEDVNKTIKGQVTVTTAYPGIIKANHYHKKMNEWYCVIKGKMHLVLKDTETGEKNEIVLSDEDLRIIKIEPGIAHGFKNIGEDMLFVLMYIDKPFDPNNTDTYPEVVI